MTSEQPVYSVPQKPAGRIGQMGDSAIGRLTRFRRLLAWFP